MARKKTSTSIELRAVVYCEQGRWIAHCLEMDLVTDGDSPEQAVSDLLACIDTQIAAAVEMADLQSAFHPAPAEYWKLYFQASHGQLKFKPTRPVDRFDVRLASVA